MLILLSPAKSLNFEVQTPFINYSSPVFLKDSKDLVDCLKKLSIQDLEKLMAISPKLAELNWQRFQDFSLPFNQQNSKPALFLFDGDVYKAMTISSYNKQDLEFAKAHLRILSGLYGILRPLDFIQTYRLEMGLNIKAIFGKNLPQFWQEKIVDFLNNELKNQREKTIINLASEEYFTAIDTKKISANIINIIFKEERVGKYKIVGLFAKKARGLMTDFIIKNKLENSEDLKSFGAGGYSFRSEFGDQSNWHFYR